MRPIGYGLIVFFGSGILWFLVSIVGGVEAALEGSTPLMPWIGVFGVTFFLSLPVAVGAEIVRWWKRRKRGTSRAEIRDFRPAINIVVSRFGAKNLAKKELRNGSSRGSRSPIPRKEVYI